ncbi:uncharacterized protein LOC134366809 [Cynocephalus volans]|uniref:uncharacterized protein LOC134366809 n=1 Tax=Cynocephalus volans TaxID=110931 RepID=UPI002FC5A26A
MAKVNRKPEKSKTVMEQPTSSTKQLSSRVKGRKKKNPCQPRYRSGGKVKKLLRDIKKVLHGSSRKKSSCTSTTIPKKVKRVKRSKKFRPLAKIE